MSTAPDGDAAGARVYTLADRRVASAAVDVEDAEAVEVIEAATGAPVDPPERPRTLYGTVTDWADADRPPIVPAWMRNRQQRRQAARSAAGYAWYRLLVELTRLPVYLAKVTWYAPQGFGWLAWRQIRWWWLLEQHGLRQEAANRNDPDGWAKLHNEAKATRAWRGCVLAAELLAVVAAALVLRLLAPWWAQVTVAATAALVLARLGRPADKPITAWVTTAPRYFRLTADMTRAAIVACGAGVKDPDLLKFPREIFRDGPGHTAIVDLPAGVIAQAVVDKRTELAGAMRLPKSQVWPAIMPAEHPSRLELWVAERPVNDMTAPPWTLLERGRADYWKPFVFGYDERMRPVTWRFDEKNSLFGGIPGSGKSLAVRVVVLAGVLDPLVIPVIFELKGTGDFDLVAPLCPDGLYGSGPDEGTKAAAMDALTWLLRECDRRGPLVKEWVAKLGLDENKLTRAMAERDPRLRPIVAVFDEVQELFTDKEMKAQAVAAATSLIKRGRALGIHLILATQRIDKESIPRGISSNIGIRFCLAVTSHIEADLVLGTGAYSRGARPTEFEPGPDSGWGWRSGLGRTAPMRAVYLTNAHTAAVVARARAMREGLAAAEVAKVQARDFLADLRGVFYAGEAWVSWPQLAERLAEQHPDVYAAITAEAVSSQARGLGVDSVNGKLPGGGGRVAKGAKSSAVDEAIVRKEITAG